MTYSFMVFPIKSLQLCLHTIKLENAVLTTLPRSKSTLTCALVLISKVFGSIILLFVKWETINPSLITHW